jgi:hypothetical protein
VRRQRRAGQGGQVQIGHEFVQRRISITPTLR